MTQLKPKSIKLENWLAEHQVAAAKWTQWARLLSKWLHLFAPPLPALTYILTKGSPARAQRRPASLLSGLEASDKQVCVLSTWDKISDKQAQGESPKESPG